MNIVYFLGCSSGKHTYRAAELGMHATGLDCSERMIERAKKLVESTDFDVEFVVGTYTELPFDDKPTHLLVFAPH